MADCVTVDASELDLALTIGSGQCFRWTKSAESRWQTNDLGKNIVAEFEGGHSILLGDLAHINGYFRLMEGDVAAKLLEIDPDLEDVISKQRGLRLITPAGRAETLISFLCTPNNNLTRIKAMVDHMTNLVPNGHFPSLEALADLPESWYRERGFGYRGATIPKAARILVDRGGDDYLNILSRGPYEVAHKALVELPGVGRKVADCIALYALHHTCAVPVDTHLWQAAKHRYFPDWSDGSLTDQRYQRIGDFFREKFGDIAGHAQLFLYHGNLLSKRK